MRLPLVALCAFLYLCLLGSVAPASAQVLRGTVPLQLRTSVFEHDSLTFSYDNATSDYTVANQRVGWSPAFGVTLGYVLREYVALTLLTSLARDSAETEAGDGTTSTRKTMRFEVVPGVRFLSAGPAARFFVGGGAGYERRSEGLQGGDDKGTHSAVISLNVGVHAFIHEYLSLEPTLEVSRIQGFYRREFDAVDADTPYGEAVSTTIDAKMSGYRFILALGLTGWL